MFCSTALSYKLSLKGNKKIHFTFAKRILFQVAAHFLMHHELEELEVEVGEFHADLSFSESQRTITVLCNFTQKARRFSEWSKPPTGQ